MAAKSFDEIRAWHTARNFKLGIYRLCDEGSLATDYKLRDQLRSAAASAPSQIAEGFARFNPADFARFVVIAKASLVEAQNHLQDAVDRRHISEEVRQEHHGLAQAAIREAIALVEYLQSEKAQQNAKRAREKRQAARTLNSEPGT
jgi:four helix bundle protein